jgi:hypothetical protein
MSFALPLSCTVEGNRLIPTRHEVRKETAEVFFFFWLVANERRNSVVTEGSKGRKTKRKEVVVSLTMDGHQ